MVAVQPVQVQASWVLGDLVDITVPDEGEEDTELEHGRRWVDGRVGMLKSIAHVRDFSIQGGNLRPELDLDHFIVVVDHDKAKGEYALARVPISWMRPHSCKGDCPTIHSCLFG